MILEGKDEMKSFLPLRNSGKAQRSGFDAERRRDEMSELSPKAEAKDMESAPTRSSY